MGFSTQTPADDSLAASLQALPNVRQVDEQTFSSGQPGQDQIALLQGQKVKALINLRALSEDAGFDEAGMLAEAGIAYHQLPVAGATDFTRELVASFDALLANYAGEPVLVHCASGNRVGAIFALRAAWMQGASVDEALELGRKSGMTRLEPAIAEMLTQSAP